MRSFLSTLSWGDALTAKIIDGKALAKQVRLEVKEEIERDGFHLKLAFVLVGEDPASQVYVKMKEKACAEVGIKSEKIQLPEDASEEELLKLVEKLNADSSVHGFIVQSPLPKQIDEQKVFNAISPLKDVDGFHPVNMGKTLIGEDCISPATPSGIMLMLERSGVELEGKRAVVVGRSNIVGKPVALMLLKKNATVTMCHSRTKDLEKETRRAEVLVVAVGKPRLVTAGMVSEGVVVIDVGMNKVEGKLMGDVDFEAVREKASMISPVPGGVGPMTVAMLMKNTLKAFKMQSG